MATVYKTTFKLRRGTMAEWDAKNPILSDGEPGFAIDKNILRIGDGVTAWKDLEDINDSNFATTDYVDNKTAGLTGAMHFRGTVTALPATTDYAAGDVVIFGSKEYVCDKDNNKWIELGDEGSHVLNTQKINDHALTGDITLNAADVGAATTADAAAATSKYYSATLTPAGWSASGSVFKNTYFNTELRASVSPVVSCTENAAEYAYITDAEATAKTGIVFTARKKPTANVILTIIDVG